MGEYAMQIAGVLYVGHLLHLLRMSETEVVV